jgi:PKD repeat protein
VKSIVSGVAAREVARRYYPGTGEHVERRNFVVAKSHGPRTLRDRMRPRLLLVLALLVLVAPPARVVAKSKKLKNGLLTVAEPHPGKPANAHPFVNVIVLFGRLADFTPADPSTFKAKMGRQDITSIFVPTYDTNGAQTGVRGRIEANHVKIGHRPRNVIRLSIEAIRSGKGPHIRDADRVRFGAVETPDQACNAQADADTSIIVPGVPVQFTASKGTIDPDRDELTFHWNFGDGSESTEPDPVHTYGQQTGDVTVTLTASDEQLPCSQSLKLEAVPPLPDGKTPGTLFIESAASLEFGAVAPGATTSKTITLKNTDTTDTSAIPLRIGVTRSTFQLSETSLLLGPGESHDVTVTFAPSAEGHQDVRLVVVANVSNRQVVTLLGHGYGGTSGGPGPTFAANPVYFTEIAPGLLGLATFAYMPDGRRLFIDNGVHTCVVPDNGLGTGDFCLTDQDCAANGGTCGQTTTCPAGPKAGQPCSVPTDCPASFCPSYTLFDPVDLCSDGKSLFLMSDEGSFTEPDPNAETERAVTVMRMDLDANGNVTYRDILDRTTTETGHLTCDGFPAGQGGQVYIAEFHNVPDDGSCFRSEREALVKIAKSNGATQVATARIDAYEGLGDCDDLDPVNQLEMLPDGSKMFAGFESGGLWQIRPTSLFFSADITDTFQAHPDGSILYAGTTDSGSTGLVNLYRITAAQVQSGPLPYSALVPCASFEVPNNTFRDALGRSIVIGFAASRTASNSTDATALVSFVASSSPSPTVPSLLSMVSSNLIVRGTVAFSAPANTDTCSVTGLVNLEALELDF